MNVVIEAPGLDYNPKLIETGNGWATVYGEDVAEFDDFKSALDSFTSCCEHAAKCTGIYDNGDYDLTEDE